MIMKLAACGTSASVRPECDETSNKSANGMMAIADSDRVAAGKDTAGAISSQIPIARSRAATALSKNLSVVPVAGMAKRSAAKPG